MSRTQVRVPEPKSLAGLLLLSAVLFCSGCHAPGGYAQQGAVLGTALGGTTGAIVGHQSGHSAEGALIGAAAGALTGGLVGDAQDARAERDAAIAQVNYQQQMAALNNHEIIRMAQSGLSDSVIIGAIQQRGGQFDLSPDGLIYLKTNGVSDTVIRAVQQASTPTAVVTAPAATATPSVHGVVVVHPRPVARIVAPAPYVPRRPIGPPRRHRGRRW